MYICGNVEYKELYYCIQRAIVDSRKEWGRADVESVTDSVMEFLYQKHGEHTKQTLAIIEEALSPERALSPEGE